MLRQCFLRGLLTLALQSLCVRAGDAIGEYPPLTVEETIACAKSRLANASWEQFVALSRSANPGAREALLKMLEDANSRPHWPNAIGMLTFIARGEDVERIARVVRNLDGEHIYGTADYNIPQMAVSVFTWMAAGGRAEAKAELLKMTDPQYWRDCKFKVYKETPPGWPSGEDKMALQACGAYMVAVDEEAGRAAAKRVIAGAKGEEGKKALGQQLENMLANVKESREVMRSFLDTGHAPAPPTPQQQEPATPVARPSDDMARLIGEATAEFEAVLSAVAKGNQGEILGRLLRKGTRITLPPESQDVRSKSGKTLREELHLDLGGVSELARALSKRKMVYGPAEVEVTQVLRVKELQRDGVTYGPIDRTERIVVRLPITNTRDLVEQFLGDRTSRLTISGKQELIVHMEKENGVWAWNPFGW